MLNKPRIWKSSHLSKDTKTVLFMGINKTGSSSIFSWMDANNIDYFLSRYKENEQRKLALIREIKLKNLISFTVVRNPWDRVVSSWKYCMDKKELPNCSFKEFLSIPLSTMSKQQRFHAGPQWPHIVDEDGKIDYLDHIGRFEAIEDTCRWLTSELGIQSAHGLPHLKKTERSHYTEYYDEESREAVSRLFRKDIELFGYEYAGGEY